MLELKDSILENLTAFRFVLFICSCSYAVIIYHWLKPSYSQLKAGIMAATVQFWIGILFHYELVELGFWKYRSMNFMVLNVPIDLHINWAILWGLGICWLSDKWPGKKATFVKFLTYISLWTLFTLFFDIMMADWMVFLDWYKPNWWIVDILILSTLQGFTVWFYKSIRKAAHEKSDLTFIPVIPPYIRSLIYLSFFICVFFIYIPSQIEFLTKYFGFEVQTYHFNEVAYISLFFSVAVGGWATHEFSKKGEGTPVPLDDPKYLVTSGPYLFMSNPMQISGILLTISVLLFNFNWINFIYLIDVALVVWLIFERIEAVGLSKTYGKYFQSYLTKVPLWKINLVPQKLDSLLKPVLFIDKDCKICVSASEAIKKLDFPDNILIKSLSDISKEGHSHLQDLANSRTTMILAEPRISEEGRTEYLYSMKGRAVLRIFGYTPAPLCFIAAYEGIPGLPLLSDAFYTLFAMSRKHF
jgi:protein-S-isoprenylcysteine O-methyltransferase Ste14/predicted DCC family thiol-disulfide oxidoreductase YuxK